MTCKVAQTRLFEYLDGELPDEQRLLLEDHVAACGECRHRLELERAFHEIYIAPLRPDQAPTAVRGRTAQTLASLTTAPPARRAPRAVLAASLAAVLLMGALWGLMVLWAQREASASLVQLADASVEQHQKLARGLLPFDIAHVSPTEAERWFKDKLEFNVRLPELNRDHLTFLGGRISHLKDFDVAALEYRVDEKNVSLFIIPSDRYQKLGLSPEPKFKMVNRQGYDVIVWTAHGAAYALVSEIGGRSCTVCHAPEEQLDVPLKPEVHRAR